MVKYAKKGTEGKGERGSNTRTGSHTHVLLYSACFPERGTARRWRPQGDYLTSPARWSWAAEDNAVTRILGSHASGSPCSEEACRCRERWWPGREGHVIEDLTMNSPCSPSHALESQLNLGGRTAGRGGQVSGAGRCVPQGEYACASSACRSGSRMRRRCAYCKAHG